MNWMEYKHVDEMTDRELLETWNDIESVDVIEEIGQRTGYDREVQQILYSDTPNIQRVRDDLKFFGHYSGDEPDDLIQGIVAVFKESL